MRTVRIDDVDTYMGPASVKRPLSAALGTEAVSINYFELEPGESFAFGYHSHANQEEVFYVIEGTATFETGTIGDVTATTDEEAPASEEATASRADETTDESADGSEPRTDRVEVDTGEAVRFAPGEYQRGRNEGTERVVALALGAPRDAGETDIRRECVPCGAYTSQKIEMTADRDALVTTCVDCGAETGRFD